MNCSYFVAILCRKAKFHISIDTNQLPLQSIVLETFTFETLIFRWYVAFKVLHYETFCNDNKYIKNQFMQWNLF